MWIDLKWAWNKYPLGGLNRGFTIFILNLSHGGRGRDRGREESVCVSAPLFMSFKTENKRNYK